GQLLLLDEVGLGLRQRSQIDLRPVLPVASPSGARARTRAPLFLSLLLLLACGSGTPAPADGGASSDLAGAASSPCQTRQDCRLYSSYCVTAPCQCIAVGR